MISCDRIEYAEKMKKYIKLMDEANALLDECNHLICRMRGIKPNPDFEKRIEDVIKSANSSYKSRATKSFKYDPHKIKYDFGDKK